MPHHKHRQTTATKSDGNDFLNFLQHQDAKHLQNIQNNYDYNIVDILEDLDLVDDLVTSSEEDEEQELENDTEDSGVGGDRGVCKKSKGILKKTPEDDLDEQMKEQRKRQRKNKKLNDVIFGGLNKPFRPLSAHPYITVDLISEGRRLCPPLETAYKYMTTRYEYGWLFC